MAAPITKRRRTATLSADGRARVRGGPKKRGHRIHPCGLSSFRLAQREAVHLLLGRTSPVFQNSRPGSLQEFGFSGLVSAGVLGNGPCPPKTSARGMALPFAAAYVCNHLLLRFPPSKIPPSYRARARHSDCVCHL